MRLDKGQGGDFTSEAHGLAQVLYEAFCDDGTCVNTVSGRPGESLSTTLDGEFDLIAVAKTVINFSKNSNFLSS